MTAPVPTDRYDLLVVGGGVFGLGTALAAARRGWRTLLLERGPIPNPIAASYGPSRKIRAGYTDPHYAVLAREAMAAWRQVEQETGRELMVRSGNLVYTTLDDQPHIDTLLDVSRAIDSPTEELDADRLRARFPQFVGARRALLETEAGFLRASACVAALRELAERHSALVAAEREVLAIEPDGAGVTAATADGRRFRGERAVLALGGWSKRLLPALADVLVQSQQGLMYLADVPPAFRHPTLPAFSCPDDGFYGFPAYGVDAMKVAQHDLGTPIATPDFDRATTPPGFLDAARAFLRDRLGLDPDALPARTESCMYNLTPGGDFLLDAHPHEPRLFVATGGSGHGFKFGSIVGDIILDRLDNTPSPRWAPQFSWARVTAAPAATRPR
jgi:sarcosine oxidase